MDKNIEEQITSRCEEIMKLYKEEAVKDAFSLIVILLKNMVNKPNEEAMRTFKKTNKNIKTRILAIKECLELMKDIGYLDLDPEFMVYQDSDMTKVNAAVKVLSNYIEIINKKLSDLAMQKELKQQEEAKRLSEEINRRFKEDQLRKMQIQKQIENDKKEKAQMEKAKDSVGKKLDYGAKVCKMEFKNDPAQRRG